MIVRQNLTLPYVLFAFRHSILTTVWPRVLLAGLIGLGVTLSEYFGWARVATLTTTPFALIGVALGIFLGFRTNASYARFWEGRQLWGRLVNVTRTLTRQLDLFLVGEDEAELADFKQDVARLSIGYVHALRALLRRTPLDEHARRYLMAELAAEIETRRNPPNAVLQTLGERIRFAWQRGWIHDFHLSSLDRSLEEITSIQGGCERISNTPVPFSYNFLIHRITAFYCMLLPFGIYDNVGFMTPLVSFMIAYGFFGLDAIGDEVEDPFGVEPNDLPLDALCRNIEIDLLQMIGKRDTPAPLQPVGDVLL
jgi:ion channel-forming bestrophin family protein